MTALTSHWNAQLFTNHMIHKIYYEPPMTHEFTITDNYRNIESSYASG